MIKCDLTWWLAVIVKNTLAISSFHRTISRPSHGLKIDWPIYFLRVMSEWSTLMDSLDSFHISVFTGAWILHFRHPWNQSLYLVVIVILILPSHPVTSVTLITLTHSTTFAFPSIQSSTFHPTHPKQVNTRILKVKMILVGSYSGGHSVAMT